MDPRKRGRPDANGGGGVAGSKRSKEADSIQTGLGSKSKPCTKFFSITGCPFGEGCHFQHYVPGGFNAVAQMTHLGKPAPVPQRNPLLSAAAHAVPPAPTAVPPAPTVKSRMCNKYNTVEGCRFGQKCHFAHGERELGRPIVPSHDDNPVPFPSGGRFGSILEPPRQAATVATIFGASATATISVDASLAGAIIGKGGVNIKHIHRITGAKLYIKEKDPDASQKSIELEGTFDQINQASVMVKELIMKINTTNTLSTKTPAAPAPAGPGSNYKTKLCDNFTKGSCTFGDRCHFAHGASELRKTSA